MAAFLRGNLTGISIKEFLCHQFWLVGRQEKLIFASRQSDSRILLEFLSEKADERGILLEYLGEFFLMLIFFTMLILLFRFYSYSQIKEQFFMIDFCYFLNLSTYLQTMLCPNDKVINWLRGVVTWSDAAQSEVQYQKQKSPFDKSFIKNFSLFPLERNDNFYKYCWPYVVFIQKKVFLERILQIEISYLLTLLLSIPSNELPCQMTSTLKNVKFGSKLILSLLWAQYHLQL